jgi:hypothetical protein
MAGPSRGRRWTLSSRTARRLRLAKTSTSSESVLPYSIRRRITSLLHRRSSAIPVAIRKGSGPLEAPFESGVSQGSIMGDPTDRSAGLQTRPERSQALMSSNHARGLVYTWIRVLIIPEHYTHLATHKTPPASTCKTPKLTPAASLQGA